MKITYQVEVDVEPGENFNPMDLMRDMDSSIDTMLPEPTDGTIINSITFGLVSVKGDLPYLIKKQEEKARRNGSRIIVRYEIVNNLWYARISGDDDDIKFSTGETRSLAIQALCRDHPEAKNMIIARKKSLDI